MYTTQKSETSTQVYETVLCPSKEETGASSAGSSAMPAPVLSHDFYRLFFIVLPPKFVCTDLSHIHMDLLILYFYRVYFTAQRVFQTRV